MNPVTLKSNEFWGKRFGFTSKDHGNLMAISRGSGQGGVNNSRPVGKRNTRWYAPSPVAMADTYKKKR